MGHKLQTPLLLKAEAWCQREKWPGNTCDAAARGRSACKGLVLPGAQGQPCPLGTGPGVDTTTPHPPSLRPGPTRPHRPPKACDCGGVPVPLTLEGELGILLREDLVLDQRTKRAPPCYPYANRWMPPGRIPQHLFLRKRMSSHHCPHFRVPKVVHEDQDFLWFGAGDGILGMLMTVLPLVALCLGVRACGSSYVDRTLRWCHCWWRLGGRVSNAPCQNNGRCWSRHVQCCY